MFVSLILDLSLISPFLSLYPSPHTRTQILSVVVYIRTKLRRSLLCYVPACTYVSLVPCFLLSSERRNETRLCGGVIEARHCAYYSNTDENATFSSFSARAREKSYPSLAHLWKCVRVVCIHALFLTVRHTHTLSRSFLARSLRSEGHH